MIIDNNINNWSTYMPSKILCDSFFFLTQKCGDDLVQRRDEIGRLTDDANRLLERPDLSANQLDEIKSRSTSMQAQVQDLTTGHSMPLCLFVCLLICSFWEFYAQLLSTTFLLTRKEIQFPIKSSSHLKIR